MGSPGGSGAVNSTPAARALHRSEPLPMRAGQAPASTPSDDVKKTEKKMAESLQQGKNTPRSALQSQEHLPVPFINHQKLAGSDNVVAAPVV